ncbi:hypothetical protein [Ktedonobacter robiniae]|uniref:Uncharacterized protein n=1 Tax=Ktedonobacter robiniae TaxID=2778365 RepID=A0ABQ3V202_9CHLR|nr:hypothetical protein [Ktedonobacter robiniae]GHO59181.1 hypothetical protein KSB_76560 [Ktedonobacter robiniae]
MREWGDLFAKFSRVTDRLGMPIDTDILEMVVALNALGITTTMSCGGHIDERGFLLPWVDIEKIDPPIRELREQLIALNAETHQLRQELEEQRELQADPSMIQEAQARLKEKSEERNLLDHQVRMQQCTMRTTLVEHLSRFYEDRVVSFDRRLILHRLGLSRTRMESQGAHDFYLCAPLEIQQQKLAEYREEIMDFARFLKHIYFSHVSKNTLSVQGHREDLL